MFSSARAGVTVHVPTTPGNAAIARFVIFLAPSETLEIFGALQIREGRDPPPHAWFDCGPSLGYWLAVGVSLVVLGGGRIIITALNYTATPRHISASAKSQPVLCSTCSRRRETGGRPSLRIKRDAHQKNQRFPEKYFRACAIA